MPCPGNNGSSRHPVITPLNGTTCTKTRKRKPLGTRTDPGGRTAFFFLPGGASSGFFSPGKIDFNDMIGGGGGLWQGSGRQAGRGGCRPDGWGRNRDGLRSLESYREVGLGWGWGGAKIINIRMM